MDDPAKTQEVQDNAREQLMRQLFGLSSSDEGRGGTDAVDADGNRFELKSGTTNQITTGRDIGNHTLQRYRERYWLICRGTQGAAGFTPEACCFATPSMLNWWIKNIEDKLAPDLTLRDRVLQLTRSALWLDKDINRVDYLMGRGSTLNNPKINWNTLQQHAIPIDMKGDLQAQLAEMVKKNPL